MIYAPEKVMLKNGREALFRGSRIEDAERLLAYLKQTAAETPFLLHEPEECTMTLEAETAFITGQRESLNDYHILCEVDGKLAGCCHLGRKTKARNRHRGMVGIALFREYWGMGIGTLMMDRLIALGREMGLSQLELEVFETNDRAMALYRKMGFVETGAIPDAIHLKDGRSLKEIYMVKRL